MQKWVWSAVKMNSQRLQHLLRDLSLVLAVQVFVMPPLDSSFKCRVCVIKGFEFLAKFHFRKQPKGGIATQMDNS